MAFEEVSNERLTNTIDVVLQPAVRVFGRLISPELESLGRSIEWTNVYLYREKHRPLEYTSKDGTFEFYLPPGSYKLYAYGTNLKIITPETEVKAEQRELNLGALEIGATNLVKLLGKPAPELQKIKEWSSGSPTMLADLRGKVVILDFWGHWCGPCVAGMSALMALHDDFQEDGLAIVAVHDSSVSSVAEMSQKLKSIKQQLWNNRELPFLVAIDGRDDRLDENDRKTGVGATTELYGITAFPTTILIDRQGIVVDQFYPGSDKSLKQLQQALGLTDSQAARTPTWRKRFNVVYQLPPGEAVAYIAAPFIPERNNFLVRAFDEGIPTSMYAQHLTLVQGKDLHASNDVPTDLDSLLRTLVRPAHIDIFDCPVELRKLKLTGDWIVDGDASLEAHMRALERILNDKFGFGLRFEPVPLERDCIVVTGTFKFQPLPGATIENGLSFTADATDHETQSGGGSGDPSKMLTFLSNLVGRAVIDERQEKDGPRLVWYQRDSAILDSRANTPPKLDLVLENLQKQTSLEFKRERRSIDGWKIRKAN